MAQDTFLGTLNSFIQISNEIIDKLNEELNWIKGHHKRCIAAKTVGTAASVGGSVVLVGSLLLAPFTGGASIVAATGYGAITAAAGAGVNLVTDITDMITKRIENSQIEEICARRNGVAERLKEYFDELERVAIELKKLEIDEESAYFLSLVNIVSKAKGIKTTADDILKLSRCVQLARGASGALLRNGGYFWKGMRLQSQTLMKVFVYLGFNVSKRGAMAVVRTGTVVLNGVFAIYDVYSLVQTIKSNHPTADAISKLIEQMQEELGQMEQLKVIANEIQKQ